MNRLLLLLALALPAACVAPDQAPEQSRAEAELLTRVAAGRLLNEGLATPGQLEVAAASLDLLADGPAPAELAGFLPAALRAAGLTDDEALLVALVVEGRLLSSWGNLEVLPDGRFSPESRELLRAVADGLRAVANR